MHVVVIGAGSIGKRHLANLDKLGVEYLSIVDPQFERRREAKDKVSKATTLASLGMAVKDRPADAVIIAVPTYLHIPVALEAVKLHVPMLIEKPLSHDTDGLDSLESLLKLNGTWAVVGYSMRYHQAITIIRDMLEKKTIGTVLSVRAEVGQYLPDWHPGEDYRQWYMSKESQGGGALLDLSHEIDYLQWLFGSIARADGFVGQVSDLDMDADDLTELVCRFRGGMVGSIHLDLLDRAYCRSCRIIGSEGTIAWEYEQAAIKWYTVESRQWRSIGYSNDRNSQFVDEMKEFLGRIGGTPVPVDRLCSLAEARKTLDLLLDVNARCRVRALQKA